METQSELIAEITPASGPTRSITDPADGEVIGEAPEDGADDLEHAVSRAAAAQPAWATLGHEARSAALLEAADPVGARAEELARLLSREQGKPLNGLNARFEVGACSAWLRDPIEARKVAARIEAGTEWINVHGAVHPLVPFGGVKRSGYGPEFGIEGLKAHGVPQVING